MKRLIIVGLLCLNAALLVALVFGAGTPKADAQVVGGGVDYMLLTGRVQMDYDALYVLDLAQRKLKLWKFDKTANRMVAINKNPIDLKKDFGRNTP